MVLVKDDKDEVDDDQDTKRDKDGEDTKRDKDGEDTKREKDGEDTKRDKDGEDTKGDKDDEDTTLVGEVKEVEESDKVPDKIEDLIYDIERRNSELSEM